MRFKPIIALCDKHARELQEHLDPMPDPVEHVLESTQEKTVRAGCDANYDARQECFNDDGSYRSKHWFYLDLELTGWRHKQAGAKGGSVSSLAKAAASRKNGAKGGRPRIS